MPLYVTMGAMAGNMLTGTPIWLMLVGASGSGKTKLLRSLLGLERVVPVSSIKGEAALLSGVKKKEIARDATGGLLRVLGDNGCLAFMDFTSVLSKSRDALNEILGVLRELFDRTWSRDIGGEGGRRLEHHGRVCLIAGVTHAIDRQADVNKEMGERCLYFRYPFTTGYQESMCAVQDTVPDQSASDMQDLVEAMFMGLGLSFVEPTTRRKLTQTEAHRIVTVAQFGAMCRSMVPRDSFKREVVDVSTPEVATRMSQELTQLYLGMEVIGNTEKERWAAMKKVAFDSIPLGRRLVLDAIIEKMGHARPMEIAREVKLSESATRRIIEDLELLGVVRKNGEQWELSEWGSEKLGQINRESIDQLELEL
jgi:ABC-type dipeptide/oligopeptide/nickel transport system ATPase component